MQNRAATTALAFTLLIGIAGLVGSVCILWLFANGTIYNVPFIGPLFRSLIGQTLYLGILVVAASLAHIIVGLLLWKRSKLGGILGLALSICEVFGYFAVLIYSNLALPMVVSLAIGSAFCFLLIASSDSNS